MDSVFAELGIDSNGPAGHCASGAIKGSGPRLESRSPIDNAVLGTTGTVSRAEYDQIIAEAEVTFRSWRSVPAPKRGEIIRQMADAMRAHKKALGRLVSLETGKILQEGEGEIQEAIDIADFCVGLSRQLYGSTMHSERPGHRMYEQWHPLGIVGVITAFNFPAAVWAWNAMVAATCGDVVVWKPSEITPLTALAMHTVCSDVAAKNGFPGLFSLCIGHGADAGQWMSGDRRVPLVSATGSCRMGRHVGEAVAKRLGRVLLELGGNNAVVVLDDADQDMVLRSVVFGAVGTAGQRCTTTRRLIVQKGIARDLIPRLVKAYAQVKIGNPLEPGTLMGPLIHSAAVESFLGAVARAKAEGGEILYGGKLAEGQPSGLYVQPTLIRARSDMAVVQEETFAPILYILEVDGVEEAVALNNSVPQGLSSAIFTRDVRSAEVFLSATGSDCGIANVNIGTSGAEIGGAFGGEKDTGGGRESGSDSWRQYMRRQTNTINYSRELPLAQGIKFDIAV